MSAIAISKTQPTEHVHIRVLITKAKSVDFSEFTQGELGIYPVFYPDHTPSEQAPILIDSPYIPLVAAYGRQQLPILDQRNS